MTAHREIRCITKNTHSILHGGKSPTVVRKRPRNLIGEPSDPRQGKRRCAGTEKEKKKTVKQTCQRPFFHKPDAVSSSNMCNQQLGARVGMINHPAHWKVGLFRSCRPQRLLITVWSQDIWPADLFCFRSQLDRIRKHVLSGVKPRVHATHMDVGRASSCTCTCVVSRAMASEKIADTLRDQRRQFILFKRPLRTHNTGNRAHTH